MLLAQLRHPPLVGAGYRVIVPDLLGADRSDKPD
jgi:hypothetical protein